MKSIHLYSSYNITHQILLVTEIDIFHQFSVSDCEKLQTIFWLNFTNKSFTAVPYQCRLCHHPHHCHRQQKQQNQKQKGITTMK